MAPQTNITDDISSSSSFSQQHDEEVVVMVTPYSTGCCVARDIVKLGYKVICLWSKGFSEKMKKHVPKSCEGLRYHAELSELGTIEATIQAVNDAADGCPVVAVICGGEAGVDLTDILSERMGLMTNGTHVKNRRDKKGQQEIIAKAGLRACRQVGGSEFHEVEDFLKNETYPVIIKPGDSAGCEYIFFLILVKLYLFSTVESDVFSSFLLYHFQPMASNCAKPMKRPRNISYTCLRNTNWSMEALAKKSCAKNI
eukprot:scaffold8194_cov118-Cylindrotheca_fusiformis.AAC.9